MLIITALFFHYTAINNLLEALSQYFTIMTSTSQPSSKLEEFDIILKYLVYSKTKLAPMFLTANQKTASICYSLF